MTNTGYSPFSTHFWRAVRDFRPIPRAFPAVLDLMSLVLLGAVMGGLAFSQLPSIRKIDLIDLEKQSAITVYQVMELQKTVATQQVTIDSQGTELARIEGIGIALGGLLTVLQLLRLIAERKHPYENKED